MEWKNKKTLIYLLFISAAFSCLLYLFRAIQKEKAPAKINLFSFLLPDSESILCINNPDSFIELLKNETADSLFSTAIPKNACMLLKQFPGNMAWILSFHQNEILFYSHINPSELTRVQQTVFASLSPYPAQEKSLNKSISIYFYALTGKKFFGYFEHNGVIVAGYSRKLLEKAALQQILAEKNKLKEQNPWIAISQKLNRKVPINLLFSTADLNLSLCVDSTEKAQCPLRLTADIYYEKGNLCCFGSIPPIQMPDSLYHQLAERISQQVERLYPQLQVKTLLEIEGNTLFYTVCGKLSVSTTSPSNE